MELGDGESFSGGRQVLPSGWLHSCVLCSWLCAFCWGHDQTAPIYVPTAGCTVVQGNLEVPGMGQGFQEASGLLAAWAALTNRPRGAAAPSAATHRWGGPPFSLPSHLSSYRTVLPGWLHPCFIYPAFFLKDHSLIRQTMPSLYCLFYYKYLKILIFKVCEV